MENNIKVILFDIDNTLLDFSACATEAIKEAFKKHGLEYTDRVFPVFLEINDKYWRMHEDNLITRDELYKKRWSEIFKRLGIDYDGPLFEQDFVSCLYKSHIPVEGARDVLEYLDGKYDLYIASNSSKQDQSRRLELAGLRKYFKEIFASEEIGSSKPNRAFFEAVERSIPGVVKEEVLMIGDSPNADISGAQKFGFKTCFFDPQEIHPDVPADYKIKRLEELKKIL